MGVVTQTCCRKLAEYLVLVFEVLSFIISCLQGNIILTDYSYTILALLRTRTDTDKDVRFAVRERFSQDTVKMEQPPPTLEGYVMAKGV